MTGRVIVLRGDAAALPLPDASVDLIVTSPPYFGLRSYTDNGEVYAGQIGSEATPREFLEALWACTRDWMRVLKPEGSLFVNLGDKYSGASGPHTGKKSDALMSYGGGPKWATTERGSAAAGFPPKSLLGMPWRYALGCIDDLGLILRAEIVWSKPNGLPESVTDRVRRSHEQVFHFTRSPRYFSAVDEVREAYSPNKPWGARGNHQYPSGSGRRDTGALSSADGWSTSQENPLGKLPGSVWEIPSQPLTVPAHLGVDHFAAFPMELPRRIILGWSPSGICTACGQGRRPVVDRRDVEFNRRLAVRTVARAVGSGGVDRSTLGRSANETGHAITGYACACPDASAPTRPAVVADPFGGTGTTALVARALDRTGITIDHSHDYSRLSQWRTADPGELARALLVPKPSPVMEGQEALFTREELA